MKRPNSTARAGLHRKTRVSTRSLHGWPNTATPTSSPRLYKDETEPSGSIGIPERVMGQNEGLHFVIVVDRRHIIIRGADDFVCRAIKVPVMAPTLVHTPSCLPGLSCSLSSRISRPARERSQDTLTPASVAAPRQTKGTPLRGEGFRPLPLAGSRFTSALFPNSMRRGTRGRAVPYFRLRRDPS